MSGRLPVALSSDASAVRGAAGAAGALIEAAGVPPSAELHAACAGVALSDCGISGGASADGGGASLPPCFASQCCWWSLAAGHILCG